jgi:hypothetical protein
MQLNNLPADTNTTDLIMNHIGNLQGDLSSSNPLSVFIEPTYRFHVKRASSILVLKTLGYTNVS